MVSLTPHYVMGIYPNEHLIRELVAYDIMFSPTSKYECTNTVSFTDIATTKWPKYYEYPWAIEALDLTKNDVVLELGCGLSSIKHVIARKCSKIVVVDNDPNVIDIADTQRKILATPNLVTQQADITKINITKFNKIVCLSVLQTLPSLHHVIELLLNLKTMLEPGGRLVLSYEVVLSPGSSTDLFYIGKEISDSILLEVFNRLAPPLPQQAGYLNDNTLISTLCMTYDKPLN